MDPKDILIENYTYELTPGKIAQFPLKNRDSSSLLVYKNGKITKDVFRDIAYHIPAGSLLIFNKTKVINARLLFESQTGRSIEIFCLEPADRNKEINTDLNTVPITAGSMNWNCMIGNLKSWKHKDGEVLTMQFEGGFLKAKYIDKTEDDHTVNFTWEPNEIPFAEVLSRAGNIPLPPYIKRKPEKNDSTAYQTFYASESGSVAAPTAGLHFTEGVINSLKEKNIKCEYVTLHVGAGTFLPVKSESIADHKMHNEKFSVPAECLQSIIDSLENPVIAAGTTSLRTIESLYWLGVQAINGKKFKADDVKVGQWEPYQNAVSISPREALLALLDKLKNEGSGFISGNTGIIIVPGYEFRIVNGLITNFHQPRSTLLLLIAAFAGDKWSELYDYALNNDFRFLSYGDSSILFK
jgi:S-adenosylmethionine:tRNA ribosyltransferase-isomerase